MNDNIISFLEGNPCRIGMRHESIEQIWNYSYSQLEFYHDYIQWLFPLKERSAFNFFAPVLTENQINQIKSNQKMQDTLKQSFQIMLHFYGLSLSENNNEICIHHSIDYKKRTSNWLTTGNHNHLRITRILKSLSLLGLSPYALCFMGTLQEIYLSTDTISDKTFNYWISAVSETDNNNFL